VDTPSPSGSHQEFRDDRRDAVFITGLAKLGELFSDERRAE
jgi:hypothetical protein